MNKGYDSLRRRRVFAVFVIVSVLICAAIWWLGDGESPVSDATPGQVGKVPDDPLLPVVVDQPMPGRETPGDVTVPESTAGELVSIVGSSVIVSVSCARVAWETSVLVERQTPSGAGGSEWQILEKFQIRPSGWQPDERGWLATRRFEGLSPGAVRASVFIGDRVGQPLDSSTVHVGSSEEVALRLRFPDIGHPDPLRSSVTVLFAEPIESLNEVIGQKLNATIVPLDDVMLQHGQRPSIAWNLSDSSHVDENGFGSTWTSSPYGLIPGPYCLALPRIGLYHRFEMSESNRDIVVEAYDLARIYLRSDDFSEEYSRMALALSPQGCDGAGAGVVGKRSGPAEWAFTVVPGEYDVRVFPALASPSPSSIVVRAGGGVHSMSFRRFQNVVVHFGTDSDPRELPIGILESISVASLEEGRGLPLLSSYGLNPGNMSVRGVAVRMFELYPFVMEVDSTFIARAWSGVISPDSAQEFFLDLEVPPEVSAE